MASSRISFDQVLQLVDDDAFGLSSGEESEFEEEGVTGYLPAVDGYLSGSAEGGEYQEGVCVGEDASGGLTDNEQVHPGKFDTLE